MLIIISLFSFPADRASLGSRFARSVSAQVQKPIQHPAVAVVGGLNHPPGSISPDNYHKTYDRNDERASSSHGPSHTDAQISSAPAKNRDAHRRTLQVEYVPPSSQTSRGGNNSGSSRGAKSNSTTNSHSSTKYAVPVPTSTHRQPEGDPRSSHQAAYNHTTSSRPTAKTTATGDYPIGKESKRMSATDLGRSISELTHAFGKKSSSKQDTDRANDNGSTRTKAAANIGNRQQQSIGTSGGGTSSNIYNQPAYDHNHSQPPVEVKSGYGSLHQHEPALHQPLDSNPATKAGETSDDKRNDRPTSAIGLPETTNNSHSINEHNNPNDGSDSNKGHQRSSTMTSFAERIFGRSAGKGMAMLGMQSQPQSRSESQVQLPGSQRSTSQTRVPSSQRREEKRKKKYPPTSMREPFSPVPADQQSSHGSVTSSSRRSISQAYNQWRSRKDSSASQSQNRSGNQESGQDGPNTAGSSKRFSFFPPSLARTFGGSSPKVNQTDNGSTAPGSTISQSAVYSTDQVDQLPPTSQPQPTQQVPTRGNQQRQQASSITSSSPISTSGDMINSQSIEAQMQQMNTFVHEREQAMKAIDVGDEGLTKQASAGQQSAEPVNPSLSDRIEQQFKELHAHEQHRAYNDDVEDDDDDDVVNHNNQHLVPGSVGGSKGRNSNASSAIRVQSPPEVQASRPDHPTPDSPLTPRVNDRHPVQVQVQGQGQRKEQGQGQGEMRSGLQGHRKKFSDIYEKERVSSGSSGAARRVMDFFRRRARTRAGDS